MEEVVKVSEAEYRAVHAIPGCSSSRVAGECCMEPGCPVHGIGPEDTK